MRVAVYDPVTGRIKRVVVCTTLEQGQQNVGTDEALALIGLTDDDSTIYIDQGATMPMPARPSAAHAFDWTTKQWYDPRTLDDFKLLKWREIKRARAQAVTGGFTVNGYTFDSDAEAAQRITQAAGDALVAKVDGVTWSTNWTLANDTDVTLSRAQMIAVGQALVAHVNTQYSHARSLRAAIQAAATKEEVEAISW